MSGTKLLERVASSKPSAERRDSSRLPLREFHAAARDILRSFSQIQDCLPLITEEGHRFAAATALVAIVDVARKSLDVIGVDSLRGCDSPPQSPISVGRWSDRSSNCTETDESLGTLPEAELNAIFEAVFTHDS